MFFLGSFGEASVCAWLPWVRPVGLHFWDRQMCLSQERGVPKRCECWKPDFQQNLVDPLPDPGKTGMANCPTWIPWVAHQGSKADWRRSKVWRLRRSPFELGWFLSLFRWGGFLAQRILETATISAQFWDVRTIEWSFFAGFSWVRLVPWILKAKSPQTFFPKVP